MKPTHMLSALLGLAAGAAAQPAADPGSFTAEQLATMIQLQVQTAANTPGIPSGYWLMDGDMQMPLSFNPLVDGFYVANLWPGGVVPYSFAAGFSTATQNAIIASMAVWEGLANVDFVVRTNQANYVLIQPSTGNNSAVGVMGGVQVINFAANQAQRVYTHELGHCLGFLHEHQRSDRPLTISPCNVQGITCNNGVPTNPTSNPYANNFPVIGSGTFWGPYDFASIMHYDRCAFSVGCPVGATCTTCTGSQETMTVNQPFTAQWNTVIGTAGTPSYLDGITCRGLYAFGADRWLDQFSGAPSNGTFPQPYNTSFATAYSFTPAGGTLFIKQSGNISAVGIFNLPRTIVAAANPIT